LVEYDDYLNLDQIEKSRTDDEGKYFKGRVEFGEGPKWRGRIVSDEL
jgi:exoribonuclease R